MPETKETREPQRKHAGKRSLWVAAAAGIAVLAVLAGFLFSEPERFETTTFSMGTFVQQTVYGKNGSQAAAKAAQAVAELEDAISWRKPDGEVAQINEAAGEEWVRVSENTRRVLESALQVSEASGGAFDPTIAPLSLLWDFDDQPQSPPDGELIEKMRARVDYTKLLEDQGQSSFFLTESSSALDLGAVGKGAACDLAAEAYRESGAEYAVIAVGGSVGIYGKKPFGARWSIAIRSPEGEGSVGTLELEEGFISTSGNYEKYFEFEGKRYHHLLDPRTGYPAETGLSSVTVVCAGGAESDALSTACFVLGYEESLPLLEQFQAGAVFLFEDHTVRVTKSLEGAFHLTDPAYTLA